MDIDVDTALGSAPAAPVPDLVSMTKALSKVRDALGIAPAEASAAVSRRLVGGVMPDISLSQLEALAAAGDARVSVTIRTDDGRSFSLTDLI